MVETKLKEERLDEIKTDMMICRKLQSVSDNANAYEALEKLIKILRLAKVKVKKGEL